MKPWNVNEMNFYPKLLEKCSEFTTTTETAIEKIHVLAGNLKKCFSTALADAEEEKQVKKRKQENATESAKDKEALLSTFDIKVSPTSLEKFLSINNLKPRFHIAP